MTRAEQDVVISAYLKEKKDGGMTLREESYLSMMINALEIEVDELYGQNANYCIQMEDKIEIIGVKEQVKYVEHTWKPITFKSKKGVGHS